jgi:hypothetical protein
MDTSPSQLMGVTGTVGTAPTWLQPQLQGLFPDHLHQHGQEEEDEGKGEADGALATVLGTEVQPGHRQEHLTGGQS